MSGWRRIDLPSKLDSSVRFAASLVGTALVLLGPAVVCGQPQAPKYEECRLDSIYPAGGRAGTTVEVEFRGTQGGLQEPRDIVIDGPGGISVESLTPVNPSVVRAKLAIAPEAPSGRRWLRVLNERSGLTNFASFQVGTLTEQLEREPNNERVGAEPVRLPSVVNGAISPKADTDWFSFQALRGQHLVAAIAAHTLDTHGQGSTFGIADFNLELCDSQGQTIAIAEDSLGLDPLIEWKVPADGHYLVRVGLLNHNGFPEAIYRLTLGEVPYLTGVFPAGAQRGHQAELELIGPNLPRDARLRFAPAVSSWFPLFHVGAFVNGGPMGQVAERVDGLESKQRLETLVGDIPVTMGEWPERLEREPNESAETAEPVEWPATVNGRFATAGDVDWYRFTLAQNQRVWIETVAHRFLRSPADTLIQLYDATGKLLAENDDDGTLDPGYESFHDYKTTDSRMLFTAPAAGEYRVRVSEQAGGYGARTVYRLLIHEAVPDFHVRHFPDAVPVWGPGSTSAVLVKVDRLAGCNETIDLSLEGLPDGWRASRTTSLGVSAERPYNPYQTKLFLTVTAPAGAKPGTCAEFHIVGRMKRDGVTIERRSWPLTLFYTSDTGFFRVSPASRVAVARPQGPWLESVVDELTATRGGQCTIPVRVRGGELPAAMPLVVNLIAAGVACGVTTPQTLPVKDGLAEVPFTLPQELPSGEFGIVVAQSWRSDIRVGMPGPCTPLIRLRVQPASEK